MSNIMDVSEIERKSLFDCIINYQGFLFGFQFGNTLYVLGKGDKPMSCYWDLLLDNIYGGSLNYKQ